jgi:hypothetical protein
MIRFSRIDPKLLKPPSQGLLAAIEEDKGIIDKLSDWLSPEPPNPVPDRPSTPNYPGALPSAIGVGMGDLTIDAAAQQLLDIRTRMADAWPRIVARAASSKLSRTEMAVWNGAQWTLTDMEIRLARRLAELDVKTEIGERFKVPSAEELQLRLQVGRFAGVPNADFGLVAGPILMWALTAMGVLLASAVAVWAGSQLVKSFSAEELSKLDVASKLVDCVSKGKCSPDQLQAIKDLNIEKPKPSSMPGWAKGIIAIGATAVGVIVAVNVMPMFRRRP